MRARPLSRRAVVVGVVALILICAAVWRFNVFGVRAASVATAFEPAPAYPGYVWTRDGHPVSPFELNTIAAPEHCGWQSATMLHIGWPPGTVSKTADEARQYIRDPEGVFGPKYRDRLGRNVTLPADARATGYRYGTIEIYVSPSDQNDAIYLVSARDTERWPRSDPMTLCA